MAAARGDIVDETIQGDLAGSRVFLAYEAESGSSPDGRLSMMARSAGSVGVG